jgi:hypothetical protein
MVAVPALGVYDDPDDLPEEPVEGNTYSVRGVVDKADTEGDYTVMVIEIQNGEEIGWVEEGEFNEGDAVLVNFKCTDKDDWEDNMGDDDDDDYDDEEETDWDDWFDDAKELDEDEREQVCDYMEDYMEDSGVEIEVTKPPLLGGIFGLLLLIIGLILMIVGVVLGAKAKKTGAPPRQRQPPQQDSYYPPPQQQW